MATTETTNKDLSELSEILDSNESNHIIFEEIDANFISQNLKKNHLPQKIEYFFTLIFLTKGNLEIILNGVNWKIDNTDKCMLMINSRNQIETVHYSNDIKGFMLGIHRDTIENGIAHIKQKILIPWGKIIPTINSPVFSFSDEEKKILLDIYLRIKNAKSRNDFRFQAVLILLIVSELLLELLNIIAPQLMTGNKRKVGYKESICNDFIIMAMDNHRKHHTLDYYANRLHISTQYLTHLVKSIHNRTANMIINDMLILDAKAMLRLPSMSIKEISFELNFADQSSFGKFFKKHTGISASKFRKMK